MTGIPVSATVGVAVGTVAEVWEASSNTADGGDVDDGIGAGAWLRLERLSGGEGAF
jgi:hypothetical protein